MAKVHIAMTGSAGCAWANRRESLCMNVMELALLMP
jgi:hypothetical protein